MLETLAESVFIWVSRYVAGLCLVSIACWGISMYLWGKDWQIRVRDAAIYLLSIGLLTVILALRPAKSDAIFWPPITWFCFSMLIVMELLWVAFLVESIVRGIRNMVKVEPPKEPPVRYPSRSTLRS